YADAAEIAGVLQGDGDASLLTERGSVQVVARTNNLLIKDTQAKLDELRSLIEQLDIPIRQVMIEARIVNLNEKNVKNLGVKWSGTSNTLNKGLNNWNVGAGLTDNVFTDLSISDPTSGINIGFATNGTVLNLELSALLSDGGGETISQPKVITADKKKAIIRSGTEIAYQEKTSSGATSVAFKDATLSLEVTPQITPDGSIIMDIIVKNDTEGDKVYNGVPVINTNEVQTQLLVGDGETIVLGGVFTKSSTSTIRKVPILGDIPYLGNLFKSRESEDVKTEMLVFITPKIITDGASLR
ncbi:type IV pilus secretin PilQ, partial [Endozoicomonas sp.]|uniref:type IV pilus secretin PilQ n=1 Tax=Endozoicomonas sp. TaxID=1892382 RepID=UPI00383BC59C